MAVVKAPSSAWARVVLILALAMAAPPSTRPASSAMMAITTRSSIRVKAGGGKGVERGSLQGHHSPALMSRLFFPIPGLSFIGSTFAQFLFHAFAQPLFDHALIVQEAGTGQALDAREHARVDAQRDGDRFGGFAAAGDGGFHQAEVRAVFRPEIGFRPFGVEDGHFFPTGERVHEILMSAVFQIPTQNSFRPRRGRRSAPSLPYCARV